MQKNSFITLNRILVLSLMFFFLFTSAGVNAAVSIETQIEEKKTEINQIKKKIATYQENIKQKQTEAASLKNQLSVIDNQIAKTNLDLKATETEIEQTKLETREIELQIIAAGDAISNKKVNLSAVLQEIHENDQKNELHIFLLNDTLSEFYNQIEFTKDLQVSLQQTLGELKTQKDTLDEKKIELDKKEEEFVNLKEDLNLRRDELQGQSTFKDKLLVQTKNSEEKYNELYWQAKRDQDAVSANIVALEKAARGKLSTKPKQLVSSELNWPVPQRRITVGFHDPSYPFRYLFEHPAIDIAAPQGTVITAPADGYVLKARDAGMGYSYISLIHANGISTVYGHVSKFLVGNDDFVARGDPIGKVGGMPGTPGAGRLTTGPHLHFEVRMNGIPVNPLNYLP